MDPVDLLQRMLTIESLSTKESALARFLVETMNTLGLAAHIDEAGNAVGVREAPAAGNPAATRELVLLGHMDVVSGVVPVRREGDLLYGRGAVDAKGPLAAFIIAAAQAKLPPGLRVVVIGAVEEECATSKGARHVARTRPAPAACIIGEPSSWDAITLGYKGRMLIEYTLERALSHTAGPEQSAAEGAVEFWQRVELHCGEFNADRGQLFDRILPSLRQINTSSDGLTERATMTIGLRLPPDLDAAQLEASLRSYGEDATIRCYAIEPAHKAERATPLARAFVQAIRDAGARPTFKLKTGTSDMNVVGPAWGCPIVAYGPGDSRLDHTPNEHVSVAEYLRAIELLKAVIRAS